MKPGALSSGIFNAARAMTVKVWITRTDTLAEQSGEAFRAAGYVPLIGPLLTLAAVSHRAAAPGETSALAFTSRNGIDAFSRLTDRRHWAVYCVGSATAAAAREYGFTHIYDAAGAGDDLTALILSEGADEVVHYSGVHVAGDLVGRLKKAGLKARREIIYETRRAQVLPPNVSQALIGQEPVIAMLYSPKAARALEALFPGKAEPISVVSISANTDAALARLPVKKRAIADSPTERAMIDALETLLPKA